MNERLARVLLVHRKRKAAELMKSAGIEVVGERPAHRRKPNAGEEVIDLNE